MAAEFLANASQEVALNAPVIFTESIPCAGGYVYHEDGTGIFILRGAGSGCFTRYQVTFNGNISIPTGGATTPVALAIAVNGEPRPTSRAIFTPSAVEEAGNVTSTAIVSIPRGCCFTLAIESVGAADTPTPIITVENANLVIGRMP